MSKWLPKMRILIVEDEKKTAAYLSKGLIDSGFIVDVADNGEDGLYLATHESYDLVILDVMLPKLNGWQVMAGLRRARPDQKVIFLTSRDDVEDRVKGLELGADDYLIKPFAFSELLARVRALLRRHHTRVETMLTFLDLEVDVVKHKVARANIRLHLSPKEFNMLVLFMQRSGEVLSRTYIAEKVWDIHFDSDTNAVDVAVKRLRQKVDDPFDKKLIHTVRGMGYVFEER